LRLRRLIATAGATIAVSAALTAIPASSATASTGVLCNTNPTGPMWPCMQINGYGNTIYDIAGWAHYPSIFGGSFVGDNVHLEFTGPGGVFLWNSPGFNLGPNQNSAAYYWIPKFHYGGSGWYCVTVWDLVAYWQNDGHTCGLVT
jgi:hypothetical protein